MGQVPVTMKAMVVLGKIIGAVKAAATVATAYVAAKSVLDPPKLPTIPPLYTDLSVKSSKYQYAPTQDINIGFQNYMDNLSKTAPYYVSRYRRENLRDDYVDTMNAREKQAAKDQPRIHATRSYAAKRQIALKEKGLGDKDEKKKE
jgi:hypothetical protein